MDVYCVIINDRHTDVTVDVFDNLNDAVVFARNTAEKLCKFREDYVEEKIDGWCFNVTYSSEGDSVWVVKKCMEVTTNEQLYR